MSTEETRTVVRSYLDAISGKEKPPAVIDRYVSDADQALKQHISDAETAFPCYELVQDALVAEGDVAALRLRLRATHQPSGRSVDAPLMIFYRVEGGKIAEHWMIMDNETLGKQLAG